MADFYYIQSSLRPGMAGVLADLAGKLDRCVLTGRAIANLPERFEKCQSGNDIVLKRPDKTSIGTLTANGVELLTITAIRAFVCFGQVPTKD